MRKITLKNDVRCFKRAGPEPSVLLAKINRFIAAGQTVSVGATTTMCYNHGNVLAIPYEWGGNEGFLLHDEVKASLTPPASTLIN